MQRLKLIFTIFISVFSLMGNAQTVEQTYATADSLMKQEQYQNAQVLLKRLTYFSDSSNFTKIYLKAGECYEAMQEYFLAAEHYEIAARYADTDQENIDITFKQVRMLILAEQGYEAFKALDEMYDLDSAEMNKYYLYKGVSYMMVDRQDSSIANFTHLAEALEIAETDEFKAIVKMHHKVGKPKPGKAKVLSYILPGAGQMYSGDVKNSLNSLIINGVFFTLLYNTAVTYTVVDAIIGVSGWTIKYYKGGAIAAEHIAIEKQNKKKDKVLQSYLKLFAAYS